MQTSEDISEKANSEVKNYLVLPVGFADFAFKTRKYKALEFLCRLKMTFRQGGQGNVPRGTLEEIAFTAGIKTIKTMDRHLKWLSDQGLIHYNRSTGNIALPSLYRRFGKFSKTGIRFFEGDNFKQVIFAGLALWRMRAEKYKQKKGLPEKKGGQKTPIFHKTDGISLNSLSGLLQYSKMSIVRFKRQAADYLSTKHRYSDTTYSAFDLQLIRLYDPNLGRKLVRRGEKVSLQVTDLWDVFNLELTRRRHIA